MAKVIEFPSEGAPHPLTPVLSNESRQRCYIILATRHQAEFRQIMNEELARLSREQQEEQS